MNKKISRGAIQRLIDTLFFPIRALFVPEERTFGLTSLRDERMEVVAKHAAGRVLDIGCGPGNRFVTEWAAAGSVGMDVFAYEGVEMVHEDMTALPFGDNTFDTVTLIAVGGHIPQHVRVGEFAEIARVLKPGGRLLMTEGERITQTVGHIWRHFSCALIGKKDMDSERGMEEDEQYCMPYEEIQGYLNTPPFMFEKQIKFMWGLNNLYIAKKSTSNP
jgi:SAM-dependent methyltransferase